MNKLLYLLLFTITPFISFAQIQMEINGPNSRIGIGTVKPTFNLDIHHASGVPSAINSRGLNLKNTGNNGHSWAFYVNNGVGSLQVYKGITLMGQFDPASGNYTASSDARLKKNIQTLSNQLAIINRLRPTSYHFKGRDDSRKIYGLIAQEVQKLLPDIVKQTGETQENSTLAVSYTELIPIIIAAMQEQQVLIEQQQEKETTLTEQLTHQQEQIDALQKTVTQLLKQTPSPIKTTNSILGKEQFSLEQNHPNPFSKNTTIKYALPVTTKNAFIKITNLNGQLISQHPINQAEQGEITIDNQSFTNGTYFYSLQVDGQIIATKRMIISQ